MLIEKLGLHVAILVVFALLAAFVAAVNPNGLGGFDRYLISASVAAHLLALLGYRFARSYRGKVAWCRWGVSAAYYFLVGFYGLVFVINGIEGGLNGRLALGSLLLFGVVGLSAGLLSQSSSTSRVLMGVMGGGSVAASMWISTSGNSLSFLTSVFAPLCAVALFVLGFTSWRDGSR